MCSLYIKQSNFCLSTLTSGAVAKLSLIFPLCIQIIECKLSHYKLIFRLAQHYILQESWCDGNLIRSSNIKCSNW
jgi:hypothetical protein